MYISIVKEKESGKNMKKKVSFFIVLCIALITILSFNIETVNAATLDEEKIDNIMEDLNFTKSYFYDNVENYSANQYTLTKYIELGTEYDYSNFYDIEIEKVKETLKQYGYDLVVTRKGGGGCPSPFEGMESRECIVKKENVEYFKIIVDFFVNIKLTIPANIEETECLDFVTSKINENKEKNFCYQYLEKINKVEKTSDNGYTVFYTEGWNDENGNEIFQERQCQLLVDRKEKSAIIHEDITKIKLETDTTKVPENTVLQVKKVEDKKLANIVMESLKGISTKYLLYDITLLNNNIKIQPSGNVKISIPIPSDFDINKLEVYRINEDGTKIKYDIRVENNYAIFETDHFSMYTIVEHNVTNENSNIIEQNKNVEKDDTPKTGNKDIIEYMFFITIASGIGIIILKPKMIK